MAENQDSTQAAEPSMEEILASIRKIIADEKDPSAAAEPAAETAPPPADGEDVLELTQMVQDDGSIVDLAAEPPQAPEPEPAPAEPEPPPEPPAPAPEPEPEPIAPAEPEKQAQDDSSLVSEGTANLASSALSELAQKVQGEKSLSMPSYTPLGNGSRTVEDMVLELLRPLLKEWLDTHLPALVEKIVQREVERISRRAQD